VNRARDIEILQEERDLRDENFYLLKCRVEGREFLIGGVYGPNINDAAFFNNLRTRVESYGIPFILGGDFNTIINGAKILTWKIDIVYQIRTMEKSLENG
jgi:hypothetical protein